MKRVVVLIVVCLFAFVGCVTECETPPWYDDCENRMTEKFIGNYNGTFTCDSLEENVMLIVDHDPEVVERLLFTTEDDFEYFGELTNSTNFIIPEQVLSQNGATLQGKGSVTSNAISLSLQIGLNSIVDTCRLFAAK